MNHHQQILIADASLSDLHILLDGLAPHVAVHLVQPGEDAIAHIFDALANPALNTLHLLAHGTPGGIMLGGREIRAADFLGRYDGSAQRDLDIAFWSCRTGAGDEGQAFVRAVAQATGARVAASADLVGQGGSWDLDTVTTSTANIPATIRTPFSAAARAQFPHALPVEGWLYYPEYPDGLGIIPDLVASLQADLNAERSNGFSYGVYAVTLVNVASGNIASELNSIVSLTHTGYWSVNVDATALGTLTGAATDMVNLLNASTNNQITFSGNESIVITDAPTVAQGNFFYGFGNGAPVFQKGVADTMLGLEAEGSISLLLESFGSYAIFDTALNIYRVPSSYASSASSLNIVDTVADIKGFAGYAFLSGVATINIVDTAANILANATNAAVTGATTITLVTGDTTLANLSAAHAVTLFDTLHTALNGNSYTVLDTAANLIAVGSDPALTGASGITLAANDSTLAGISVSSAQFLFDSLHAGLNGNTYSIADNATDLINYWWDGAVSQAASITLVANDSTLAGITVGQAQALFDTLHAALNGNTYSIIDTATNLLAAATDIAVTGASNITLAPNDTGLSGLTVGAAITLFDTLHAALNSNTYTIADTAQDLLAAATDPAVTGATSITLTANDSTLAGISVNGAMALVDTLHVAMNGNTYSITDSAAALLAAAADPAVAGATSITLAANDSTLAGLSVASAMTLFDTLHAALNGNSYGITDTATNLLANASDSAVTGAASLTLAPNDNTLAGISVTMAETLFDTLHAALNGNTYSIIDTGAALLAAATDPAVTGATTVSLAENDSSLGALSADAAITLFDTLHAALNGNTYAITDSAVDLLAHATDAAITGATSLTLVPSDSSLTGISVSDAMTLFDTLHAGLNGNSYAIADTAAHLMANSGDAAVTGASALDLSADASLSLTDAGTLTSLPNFSLNGHNLNLADSIANLTGHTADFGATSYSVVDSAADILAASTSTLVTGASAVSLSADASLSVADATTLAGLNSFSTNGHTLNLDDSIANLTGHLDTAGASTHAVLDTASDILAVAGSSIVTGATAVDLSADASLSVANATTLTGIANFSLNGHALSLADSIANLTGHLTTGGATGYSVVDSAENIAQYNVGNSTWTVNSLIHDGTAVTLTDAASPAELATIEAADPSGALTIVPTSLSTPNAFMIANAGTPSFNIPYGTAADVIAAPGDETIEIAQGGKLKLTGTDGHDTIIFDGYQPGSLVMTQSGTTAIFTDATSHAVVASISMDSTFAAAETIQYADGSQVLVTLVGTPLALHLTPIV